MKYRTKISDALKFLTATGAAILAGCTAMDMPPQAQSRSAPPTPDQALATPGAVPLASRLSEAATPRDYRRDAARHLYGQNGHRIYHGRMPPLLYAIGVLQVEVDGNGQVTGTNWLRAPTHAPEVVAEIERIVRVAGPFPAPSKMGRVTYTDTWLWDKSGNFQLDTLTEGQM